MPDLLGFVAPATSSICAKERPSASISARAVSSIGMMTHRFNSSSLPRHLGVPIKSGNDLILLVFSDCKSEGSTHNKGRSGPLDAAPSSTLIPSRLNP